MSNTDEPVCWGILGAARIADGAILPALRNSPICLPWAVTARDADRARAMAERHSAPKSYGS